MRNYIYIIINIYLLFYIIFILINIFNIINIINIIIYLIIIITDTHFDACKFNKFLAKLQETLC
jgi:hypothetical protein